MNNFYSYILIVLIACSTLSDVTAAVKRKPAAVIKNDKNMIALTFDDGPSKVATEKILAILEKHQVKVTFFQVGKNIKKFPELSKLCAVKGHQIGNHSMSHPKLPELGSREEILSELKGSQELIAEVAGVTPTVFRAPYLKFDDRVWSVVDELGLKAYNAAAYCDYKKKGAVEDHAVLAAAKVKSGSVILLHERPVTLQFLEQFIVELKNKGFVFKTLDELGN